MFGRAPAVMTPTSSAKAKAINLRRDFLNGISGFELARQPAQSPARRPQGFIDRYFERFPRHPRLF